MNGNIIKRSYKIGKSYNFKMQMGGQFLAGQLLSLAFKERLDD
jgi:hypothetical protein